MMNLNQNLSLNDFYVLVDTETKFVIDKIQKLPENWKNISGLPGLTNEQLLDLNWAGHHNIGWININSELIKKYKSSPEKLELNKNILKYLITEKRKEKQEIPIEYQRAKFKQNNKTLYALYLLKDKNIINFKCLNGYYTFNSEQIKDIYDIIDTNIQKYFTVEMSIFNQINACQSVSEFSNINYDI